jgi:hypothetical protein
MAVGNTLEEVKELTRKDVADSVIAFYGYFSLNI